MKNCIVFLSALLVTACSGVKVLNTETGDQVDFSKYKTFDFFSVKASGDTIPALFNARIDILKEAISTELVRRGYRQFAGGHPDMLVNIGITVKERVETRQTDWKTDGAPMYMGQRNYSWKSEEVELGSYREGTVSVHLVDAQQNKMIWKGVVQSVLPEKQRHVQESAQKRMQVLFAKFPVAVK